MEGVLFELIFVQPSVLFGRFCARNAFAYKSVLFYIAEIGASDCEWWELEDGSWLRLLSLSLPRRHSDCGTNKLWLTVLWTSQFVRSAFECLWIPRQELQVERVLITRTVCAYMTPLELIWHSKWYSSSRWNSKWNSLPLEKHFQIENTRTHFENWFAKTDLFGHFSERLALGTIWNPFGQRGWAGGLDAYPVGWRTDLQFLTQNSEYDFVFWDFKAELRKPFNFFEFRCSRCPRFPRFPSCTNQRNREHNWRRTKSKRAKEIRSKETAWDAWDGLTDRAGELDEWWGIEIGESRLNTNKY